MAALPVMIVGVSPAHANAEFNYPRGVAVDRQGNIFVADFGNGRVVELSPKGRVLRAWQAGCDHSTSGRPSGLALDRLENVYVTDWDCVLKYSSRGRLLGQFGTAGDGEFKYPLGVAVGGRGNIFVANRDKHSIEKLSPSGHVLATWDTRNSDGDAPVAPESIAVDGAGIIYTEVCKIIFGGYITQSCAIQKRRPDGGLLAQWFLGDHVSLYALGVGGRGNVFVGRERRIVKLSPDGERLAVWWPRGVTGPSAIATDSRGNLYVADARNVIVKLSSTGRELAVWPSCDCIEPTR